MGLRDSVTDTSEFYDRWTELFQRGFGTVFQAGMLKTGDPPREDPIGSVLALADRAGIRDGDRVLDAGCGVGGPACIIAGAHEHVSIDAVTNSRKQAAIARQLAGEAGLGDRVRVHLADFQYLPFNADLFDVVVFMESTGYAVDVDRLYGEAARVLRPGGRLYVKDVFCVGSPLEPSQEEQMAAFDQLWGCVRSKTIEETEAAITNAGLRITGSARLADIGTARLAGSMFTLDPSVGMRPTPMGRRFAPRGMNAPIEFGEILAIKPD